MLSKCKLFLFVFFLLFFISASEVSAQVVINEISSYPNSVVAGQEFDVSFSVSGLSVSTDYYSKALGGNNFTEADTWSSKNSGWLQQNASWTDMPEFTTNSEGGASVTIKTRFEETSSGDKEFKVRIRKVNVTPNIDSSIVTISVTAVTPTPTPEPTPTPTLGPTSTPTPTSTKTPTATSKPTVKAVVTKKPKVISTKTTSDEDESETLGLREGLEAPSPTPIPESEKKGKIPITAILFVLGGLGFMGVAGYPFLKSMKKRYNIKNEEETGAEGGFKSGDN